MTQDRKHHFWFTQGPGVGLLMTKILGIFLLMASSLFATERVGAKARTFRIPVHYDNPPSFRTSQVILSKPSSEANIPVVTNNASSSSAPISEPEPLKVISTSSPTSYTVHQIEKPVGSIFLEAMWNCDDHPLKEKESRLYIAHSQDFSLLSEDIKRICTPWYSPSGNTFATLAFNVPQSLLTSMSSQDTPLDNALESKSMILMQRAIQNKIYLETCTVRGNDLYARYRKYAGYTTQVRKREGSDNFEVFVGFYINVNMTREQCYTLDQPTTSLAIETGKTYDEVEIAHTVAKNFLDEFLHEETVTKEGVLLPEGARRWTSSIRHNKWRRNLSFEWPLLEHRTGGCVLKSTDYAQFQLAPLMTAITLAQLLNSYGIEAKVRWPHHVTAFDTDLIIRHGISNFNDFNTESWVDKACKELTKKGSTSEKLLLENLWAFYV